MGKKRKKRCYCGIGGQAVLEGVMMKNQDSYAVAVRRPDGEIELKKEDYKGIWGDKKITKIPFLRGVFNFIDSLVLGMSTLTWSAQFFEEDEPEKNIADQKKKAKKPEQKETVSDAVTENVDGKAVWNGEHSPLKDLPRIHMLYAEKLKKEAISDLQSEQQPETYKSRIEACREAILETGKAIFWQKCISRQPEKNDKEVNQMYEVQKELYVYLDSLEDLKHYAEKKKRIDAEIEKAEEEHAREAALYAQQKKEDALRNAEMMGVIFGAEMEAYLLARDFAEEIKEDPWLYCALTDVDPWLVNIL